MPRSITRPARLIPAVFAALILLGSAVLSLPFFHADGQFRPLVALFTATSAVCVTGLSTVDVSTYWTPLGQGIILALIQLGGFGIVSSATLISILITDRLGLTTRLSVISEARSDRLGEVGATLLRIARTMLIIEVVVAALLTARFAIAYDDSLVTALWHGVFHSVSSFNNAGFALYSDSLSQFVDDPWISLPICAAIILGGLGFPILFELLGPTIKRRVLGRERRISTGNFHPNSWSIHTSITVWTSLVLLVLGTVAFLALEWDNPVTLGSLDNNWDRLLASFFHSVQPRTAGFNSLNYGEMRDETLSVTTALMFIGGGSAGTAGGIKVTTFMLLAFVILAEARGEQDVVIGPRRIPESVQRQALSIALIGVGAVSIGTFALLLTTPFNLTQVSFEAVSAFATVGLSTGITPELGPIPQFVLIVLMFVGRVGPVTAASFFALRERKRLYRLPEARPLVG